MAVTIAMKGKTDNFEQLEGLKVWNGPQEGPGDRVEA